MARYAQRLKDQAAAWLMRAAGLQGATLRKCVVTTPSDPQARKPVDLMERNVYATAPDLLILTPASLGRTDQARASTVHCAGVASIATSFTALRTQEFGWSNGGGSTTRSAHTVGWATRHPPQPTSWNASRSNNRGSNMAITKPQFRQKFRDQSRPRGLRRDSSWHGG